MRPTESTLKRLFANSGNRCSFPKCTASLVVGETLVGEVCHIKDDQPGAARYDATLSDKERQAYDNLIVMCPTHHTVIDDDVASYTVDRLLQIKAEHETQASTLSGPEADRLMVGAMAGLISNVGQSGGIAAQNIHAHTLNVHGGTATDATLQARRVQAVEVFWQAIQRLADEFTQLVFVDNILTKEEIDTSFKQGWKSKLARVEEFRGDDQAVFLMRRAGAFEVEAERPFVSQRTWAVYFVVRAIYGRVGYLFSRSFETRSYCDWQTDSGVDQLLRSVLPPNALPEIKTRTFGGLRMAIDYLEEQFMAEAGMRK